MPLLICKLHLLAITPDTTYNRIMSQTQQLYQLQQVDSSLDTCRQRLAEIETALQDSAAVKKAARQLDAAMKVLQAAQLELKRTEQDVNTQEEKIAHNQKVLYSGSVTNPKELEDLQMEAEALSRHLSVLEEKQIEAMLVFEEAESSHRRGEGALESAQIDNAHQNTQLLAEKNELLLKTQTLDQERDQILPALDHESLTDYTALREKRGGIAVALVKDNICQACGGALTAAQAQAARSPNLITHCASCGRILAAT